MPPQQTPSAGTNPVKASDGTPLNPLAVNLAKAIRQQESGGDYNAVGDSGESHGAYQFNKDNYKNWASEYGVNPNDMSPVNQDKVAYARINSLLQQGRSPSEVAAIWNGAKDVNGKYEAINPSYVEGVKNQYAKIVGSSNQSNQTASVANAQPNNPAGAQTAGASTGTPPADQESILGKIMDFAFPIVNDVANDVKGGGQSNKSALQQIGDAGLSALWFAPGIGEGAEAAIRGAGLLGETGAKIAGQALGGGAIGYGSDVASKLSQGDTNAGDILTPGAGTLTGGVLGGVLGKVASKYSKSGLIEDATKSNNSVLGQTKRGANELAESFAQGKDTGNFLAQKGINLPAEVNPETVAYDTAEHAQNLRNDVGTLNSTLTDALKVVPGGSTVTDIESNLENKIRNGATDKVTADEQVQLMKNETAKWRQQYGEDLSAADLNDLKKRNWDLSKFDATKTNATLKTHRMIGNALKTSVEDIASKGGLDGVKEMNEYMGQHLDAADALDRVNGTKAKGGRLGDLLQKHALGAVGGVSGAFGGGPVGAIVGAMAGEYAGGKLAKLLRYSASSPIKTAMLKRLIQEDPEVVQKMIAYSKQTPQGLEALKEQLANAGIDIFKGSAQKAKVAAPASKVSKLAKKSATGLLIGAGSRAGSATNSPTQ